MHLKRLDLYGFKSFAEKVKFNFEPGITVIVGPNGCGKTNIADATRWVLGEQSMKLLRAERMEDLIFSGSEGRKPLGMAEVSLTLSNTENILPLDYNEVTVTRRLFRSGESDYFINKSPCRLKDISELFMDTGMSKSAYSLIEHGKIDLILNRGPEERRPIFEEAAGITKYKTRKAESLRKLENTGQNLLRINDIIGEVEHQLNQVNRQARKAERYKEKKEELKNLEIKLNLEVLRELEKEGEALKKDSSRIKEEMGKILAGISTEESKEEKLKLELTDLEKGLSRTQEESYKTEANLDKLEGRISLFKERKGNLKEERKRSALYKKNLEEKLFDLKGRVEEKEKILASVLKEIKEEETKERELKGSRTRKEEENQEKEKLIGELKSKDDNLRDLFNSTGSRLHFLEELTRSYEGMAQGVRTVLLAKGPETTGKIGVVADLLSAPPELELAVEAALGSGVQNILTNNLQEAREWIEFLKKEGKGKATFLPLNTLEERETREQSSLPVGQEVTSEEGVIGRASDLVEFPSPYRKAIEYLLGNTLIVKDLETAVKLLESQKVKVGSQRLATLEGEVIEPAGAMSGGSSGKKEKGFLGRKREIGELKKRLKEISEERGKVIQQLDKFEKESGDLKREIIKLQNEVTEIRVHSASLKEREEKEKENIEYESRIKEELLKEAKTREKEAGEFSKEEEELEKSIRAEEMNLKKLSDKESVLKERLSSFQERREDLSRELAEREGDLRVKRRSLTAVQSELHDYEMKETEIRVKREDLARQTEQDYEVSLDSLNKYEEEVNREETRGRINSLKESIERMGAVNLFALEEREELESRFSFLKEQRNDLIKAKEDLHKLIGEINETAKSLFLEAFSSIEANFKKVFRQLFTGGQAGLSLVDEDDPLETGIEIFARPPGKKLQNISLLSGGEKALTAIALLFAIFMSKPTPFCILDEIDAALDEANIGRFCRLLSEFAKISQFIVVTHSRRTIEIADVMYGVTMEEAGVSRLISVKFAEAEALAAQNKI